MNPTNLSLKELQIRLLACISRWSNYGVESEMANAHLPHVVCLLQSIGYNLRRIDLSPPEGVTPLRDGLKGTKVVITCGYSGQRCFLELPEAGEQCKCLNKKNKSHDSFWEVIGTDNSLIESGAGVIPAMPKDLNSLLKNVLIMLIHFMEGTSPDNSKAFTNGLINNATSSPNVRAQTLSGHLRNVVSPAIILSSPSKVDQARNIPQVTPEKKETLTSHHCPLSPEINSSVARDESGNIIKLLEQAISLLHSNVSQEMSLSQVTYSLGNKSKSESSINLSPRKPIQTPESKTHNEQTTMTLGSKPKSRSSPQLSPMTPVTVKNTEYKTTTPDIPISVPTTEFPTQRKRTISNSTENKIKSNSTPVVTPKTTGVRKSIPKLTPKSNNAVINRTQKKTEEPKITCNKCTTICGCAKTKKLYTNIKSTIPKLSPLPRLVKKKQ